MKSTLLAIALILSPLATFAADIASVNYTAIEDDLRDYYLAKPENAELKQKYQVLVLDQDKKMQKAIADGKKGFDWVNAAKAEMEPSRFEFERKINSALKKELYNIVTGLGLKYELIYDSSQVRTIIYAKSQVDDVTNAVKQAIMDLAKKK